MMGLEFDDSLKTYNVTKASHRSVLWRERPFRAASLCLGLLCVLLLTGIIIISHHYQVAVDQSINNSNMSMKLDQLKTSNNKLIEDKDQLLTSNSNLTQEKDQLRTSNNYLTQERDQLKTNYNNMSQERDLLRTNNKYLTMEGYQLKTSNKNLTQEKDLLRTSNKYLTKKTYQLQTSNNNLTQEKILLQTSNKKLTKEMYQLQTINNNLTQERDLLQTSNKNLTKEMYQLQTINNNLTQERDLLQTSNKNLTKEMYQLQTIINNVTLERDQFKELNRLKDRGCLQGWQLHGGSCYFLSTEKKPWLESRQDCLNRGADLVIIKSQEEQKFIDNFCCAVWIGLHDMETESKWKWVDGSPLELDLWDPGEPNNEKNEDCAELLTRPRTWNDIPCSMKRNWVCMKQNL